MSPATCRFMPSLIISEYSGEPEHHVFGKYRHSYKSISVQHKIEEVPSFSMKYEFNHVTLSMLCFNGCRARLMVGSPSICLHWLQKVAHNSAIYLCNEIAVIYDFSDNHLSRWVDGRVSPLDAKQTNRQQQVGCSP